MSISLCIIIKNEEKLLDKFLKNIKKYVDEIVVVDTGSKDKTKKIAQKYTTKVYDFIWDNNFAKARNFSIKKAAKDWILIMDPDEIIVKKDLEKLRELTENKEFLGYRFIQKSEKSIRGICRLFQRRNSIKFCYRIHESVRPSIMALNGKIGKTDIIIKHKPKQSKKKKDYYLQLLKQKMKESPYSSAEKEYELELKQ